MPNNTIRLEKPNRACGSSTYLYELPNMFPDMSFMYVTLSGYHMNNLRNMFRKNRRVDLYTYQDINTGKYFGRYGLRDEGIVVLLDYLEPVKEAKSLIDMHNLHQFVDLCGGHLVMEIESPRSIRDNNAFIYAPYIPLQYTQVTI